MSDEALFEKHEIYGVVLGQTEAVKKHVQEIPANTLLNASEFDLIAGVVREFRLDVPTLKEDEIHIAESEEIQVDVRNDPRRLVHDRSRPCLVPGTKTVIAVPFAGDPFFFRVRPQTHMLNPSSGHVEKNEILLTYISTNHDGAAIKAEYQRAVINIKNGLKWLSESTAQFNSTLGLLVAAQVTARKGRLLADAGMTAAIGLPLKKREGAPVTYSVPVKRRLPKIEPAKVSGPFTPEPTLANEEYNEILRIMGNMVKVIEWSPHAFQAMGEEDLRSHFLVQLNGAYAGQATGETFNFQGKTDILIRVDGKNVFIAECKFWHGEKVVLDTISQLLSYLNWRDTKTAVLVFNRKANFSGVLTKIAEAVPKHPNFKRDLGRVDETTFQYVFAQPNDSDREMILTVLAFDIPSAPADIKTIAAGQAGRERVKE